MMLLTGANISIRQEKGKYIAVIYVGNTHHEVIADDPIRAVGLAVILQAGFTEGKLKKELETKKTI